MLSTNVSGQNLELDMELCRAMFEKDPDRLLVLVSKWLEMHKLRPSDEFQMPAYLDFVLSDQQNACGYAGTLSRHLAS